MNTCIEKCPVIPWLSQLFSSLIFYVKVGFTILHLLMVKCIFICYEYINFKKCLGMFLKIAFCIKLLLYILYISIEGVWGGLGGPYRYEYLAVKCDSSEVAQLI